jgi:hemolysin III
MTTLTLDPRRSGRQSKAQGTASLPCFRDKEVRADIAVHLLAIFAAIVACSVLLPFDRISEDATALTAVSLYLVGLFAMLFCSAVYNGRPDAGCRDFLRRCDQAAILLLIAGTYSPFMAGATDDPRIAAAYAGVWIVTLAGLIGLFAFPRLVERAYPWGYVLLGWAVLAVLGPLSQRLSSDVLALICIGGVFFTAGLIFHLRKRGSYNNAIWHGFVTAGAGCHYLAVVANFSA